MPDLGSLFAGDVYVRTLVTVLVIMDPLGNIPVFLALTPTLDLAGRRRAARQAVTVAAGVILLFALFGERMLAALNVSLQALQIAGGLLLVLIALELLRPEATEAVTEHGRNIALVPLGTPLLAGPGAIAATMLAVREATTPAHVLSVILALLSALGLVYGVLRYAGLIGRALKENGIHLVSRVMGLLLAAIAVELVATGVAEWVQKGL
jgi:multiple antibiotic resistance protein